MGLLNPGRLDEYPISRVPKIQTGYLGYTMQQYITKTIHGKRRPTRAYETIISSVPRFVDESLGRFYSEGIDNSLVILGDVPHLYSLIPLAQSVASPILDLQRSDGLVGAQYSQREQYGKLLQSITEKILRKIEMESR